MQLATGVKSSLCNGLPPPPPAPSSDSPPLPVCRIIIQNESSFYVKV